jgi:hypothetical protein
LATDSAWPPTLSTGLCSTRWAPLRSCTITPPTLPPWPIVDEAALIAALQQKRNAGAALDVFDRKPLPNEHPLRTLGNVLATPHIGYVTRNNYRTFFNQMIEDIRAWHVGAPIRVLA